jgi:glyoxalase superfamily protein
MHRSRLCALLIDCNTSDIDRAAHFWASALGRAETDDIAAEVARLEALGAAVVSRLERWVVMQAPTGQRFCVVRVQRPGFPKNAAEWP